MVWDADAGGMTMFSRAFRTACGQLASSASRRGACYRPRSGRAANHYCLFATGVDGEFARRPEARGKVDSQR